MSHSYLLQSVIALCNLEGRHCGSLHPHLVTSIISTLAAVNSLQVSHMLP